MAKRSLLSRCPSYVHLRAHRLSFRPQKYSIYLVIDVSYAGGQPCEVKAECGPQLRKGCLQLLYHTKDLK